MGFIYKITNQVNKKAYIGQTINNVEKRFNRHLLDLKANRHHNEHFQRSFNKYGEKVFKINTIRKINDKYLNTVEKNFIKKYKTNNRDFGYNLTNGGEGILSPPDDITSKANKSRQEYFLNKYGVNHNFKIPEVQKKRKKTFLKKYGVDNPSKNLKIKEKRKKTYMEKYGVSNPGKLIKGQFNTIGSTLIKDRPNSKRPWRTRFYYNGKQKDIGRFEDPFTGESVHKLIGLIIEEL